MADHRINEGILDAMPGERRNIGITRGGSGNGTDAELCANALHTFADLAVEVVAAALHVGLGSGVEENLREDPLSSHRLAGVLIEELLKLIDDGDVDDDLGSVGNLATDIGQFLVKEIVIAPLQFGEVFQVAAVAEIEDNPPVSGFLAVALVIANLQDVGHGDEILLATGALLDGELGSLADDVVFAQAVHDGTKGTEIDAARGSGKVVD